MAAPDSFILASLKSGGIAGSEKNKSYGQVFVIVAALIVIAESV